MQIITERLFLIPLDDTALQKLMERTAATDPETAQAYSEMLAGCRAHPEQWLWYTAWGLYQNDSGDFIGDLCFKGLPEKGHPEIGYGLLEEYWNQGYATEAVRAACQWALAQPGITAVEAETAPSNTTSQAVLRKVGFLPAGTMGEEGPRFILHVQK